MKLNETPAHCAQIEDEVDGKPWYYDIWRYIKDQQYSENVSENDKRILRKLSTNFFVDGEILYKKGKDQMLRHKMLVMKGYVDRMYLRFDTL